MMTEQTVNIDTGQQEIQDVDADSIGNFIAITNDNTVIAHDHRVKIEAAIAHPIIRRLSDDTFIVVDCRTTGSDNGHIFNFDGQLLKTFLAGDGVNDVIVHHDKIVVAYFDEGVFGAPGPNTDGLAVFDTQGNKQFGVNSSSNDVTIDDCYCICRHQANTVLFYAYGDFDVVELNLDTFAMNQQAAPKDVAGTSALSGVDDGIVFYSPYSSKNDFFLWDRKDQVKRIGSYPPRLRGIGDGYFLAHGTSGYTIVSPM